MKISCIYRILNVVNGKFYIGSTINLKQRTKEHKGDLRTNKHHCVYLQRSWNKHGEESFVWEVLEECDSNVLLDREQYYMDTMNPSYNLIKDARRPSLGRKQSENVKLFISQLHKGHKYNLGRKASDATKALMSSQRKGRKHKLESIAKMGVDKCKTIIQCDLQGNPIREWSSVKEASESVTCTRQNISKSLCRSKGQVSAGGYIWNYKVIKDKLDREYAVRD